MPQILGSVLPHVGSLMDALFFTPTGAARDDSIGLLPTLPVPVNYPQYNSAVLLPLQGPDYSTKVKSNCSTIKLYISPHHSHKNTVSIGSKNGLPQVLTLQACPILYLLTSIWLQDMAQGPLAEPGAHIPMA